MDGASGNGQEIGRGVAVDSSGAVYITGGTSSANFPVTTGAFDTSLATGGTELGNEGASDVFVAKFAANGQLVWATYIGGPNYDRSYALAVDSAGDVYVAGRAGRGFPTTSGALQTAFGGDNDRNSAYGAQDGFVTKLAGDGGSLIWSTFFGGSGRGFIRDLDIDPQGRAHIGFNSYDNNPHITSDAHRSSRLGVVDAGYAVIAADGQSVEYATYLGGTSGRFPNNALPTLTPSVRVRANGGTYFSYLDNANDVQTTANAFQPTISGNFDMVVSKFSPQRTIEWTTYVGGSAYDEVETHGLTIDANDRPVIGGNTESKDFPVTNGAFQTSPGTNNGGDTDAFLSILSADGTSLFASTFLASSANDQIEGMATMSDGTIVVSGATSSSFLPTDANSYQSFNAGSRDGFVVQFSADLSAIVYSTYIGGSGDDTINDIYVGPQDVIGIAGGAGSSPFPTVNSNDMNVDGTKGAIFGRFTTN
jgi:hypothetical protein